MSLDGRVRSLYILIVARLARVVAPGWPHHVVQRGVRSMDLFRLEKDQEAYLDLLDEFAGRYGLSIWAWCLMTNHVHLVAVPDQSDSLARAVGEAHRRYTRMVNFREQVRGHLFQERFHSFPVQDDRHLLAVVRYVERNPVRAGMVHRAEAYPWSSARHHATGATDRLVKESPIRRMEPDWRAFLREGEPLGDLTDLRRHVRTGRVMGTGAWVKRLERRLGRILTVRKGGWPKGRPRKTHAK